MDTNEAILKKFGVGSPSGFPVKLNCHREHLPELFKELNFKVGVEIGVGRGIFSECLCVGNPEAKLFSIDPWSSYDGYKDYPVQKMLDGFEREARDRLSKYPNCVIVKKMSTDAVSDFENQSLDYVYIDGNHQLCECYTDIKIWSEKVRSGGIICGHDYKRMRPGHPTRVFEAVNAYVGEYNIQKWFLTGENTHTFLWVK